MINPRYAILLDGGFVTKKLQERHKHFPTADEVLLECERIKAHAALANCELLRIYFYDAPPANDKLNDPRQSPHRYTQVSLDTAQSI